MSSASFKRRFRFKYIVAVKVETGKNKMIIKVMTYNIQHCRNHNLPGDVIDFVNTAEPILKVNPDIVGLNEVRRGGADGFDDQPKILAEMCGGTPVFGKAVLLGDGMEYGNAVISKLHVSEIRNIPIPCPDTGNYSGHYEPRAVLGVTVEFGGKTITVFSVHAGLKPEEHENAVKTLVEIIKNEENPVILLGDFNMTPENEILKQLASVVTDTAAELGNRDFTFSSDNPCKTIDYIWYKGLKPLHISTVKGIYSDHFPLTAEFEV